MYCCYSFKIIPPEPGSEIVLALLSELPFDTFEITSEGLNAYCKELAVSEMVLPDFSKCDFTLSYTITSIPFQNWNETWEAAFEPIQVAQVYIHAAFHKPNVNCKYNVCITPKMSFGTGHHYTTRLMCGMLQNLDLNSRYIWDIGTGTGILAILSKLMGGLHVDATDTEFWALDNARENAINNFTNDIQVHAASEFIPQNYMYDVILANINKNVLKHYAPICAMSIKHQGQLLISGFFETDTEELIQYFKAYGFESAQVMTETEWAAIRFNKSFS
jgi:ribosomal protein L11 methyltransferase